MNELDIDLSKKSKIIEIGSVEKKLQLFKVGQISENPKIRGFSYSKSRILIPKLSQIFQKLQKVFPIDRISFLTRF